MNLSDIQNPPPPEKIYNWLDSQLSIARFYGGINFRGRYYAIDMSDPDRPLVRQDVAQTEAKDKKAKKRQAKQSEHEKAKQAARDLW